jgi:hypothetical protein
MNVLVDRHHAGLYYSLQLLFEDRFGLDLYTPVGHEWWDEGYWRFGQVFGDDRLAQQYLELKGHPWELYDEADGVYVTYDVEYPDRPIYGITYDGFRRMGGWEYTIATVQENQHGFDRLAKENGAQAVYQVGNRGQFVDWGLDPIVLCSAEAPILGRGVVYHQEYDKDGLFAARPLSFPPDIRKVSSFVNCFNSMPEQWATFNQMRELKPHWHFDVHGHDGYSGLVQPTTAIADKMEWSGWAWHDKPQGDGFGHVIHYWASIGRPLIGHASYYAGLMPAPLWEDKVTCLDLGARSLEATSELMSEIASDPDRHRAMCRAIRERVDSLVDFDSEAERIAALLGR